MNDLNVHPKILIKLEKFFKTISLLSSKIIVPHIYFYYCALRPRVCVWWTRSSFATEWPPTGHHSTQPRDAQKQRYARAHTHTHTHTLSLSHTRGPFTNCFDIRPHRHSFVYQRTCFSLSQASPELTRHPPSMMGMHAVCRKDKANSDDGRLVQRSLPAHVDQSHLAITLALNDVSLFVFGNAQQYAILTHAKEACQL